MMRDGFRSFFSGHSSRKSFLFFSYKKEIDRDVWQYHLQGSASSPFILLEKCTCLIRVDGRFVDLKVMDFFFFQLTQLARIFFFFFLGKRMVCSWAFCSFLFVSFF